MYIFIFSRHVLQRMVERSISREAMFAILYKRVPTLIVPSEQYEEIDLHYGKVHDKYLLVFVNRNTHVIVTVRSMRTKEKKIFEEACNE